MSRGELNNVISAVGDLDEVINPDAKDQDTVALIKYISPEDKIDKTLENQQVLKTPIVRNGKQATVGYQPEIWKTWNQKMTK